MTRVLFFGRLRDIAGCAEREVALDGGLALAPFRARAAAGDARLEVALASPSVRVAVNATIAPALEGLAINPDDEVAFMPPFSGG